MNKQDKSKRIGGRRNSATPRADQSPRMGSHSRGKIVAKSGGRRAYVAGQCRNKES